MAERKTGRRRGSNPVKPRTIDLKAEKVEDKPKPDDTSAKKPTDTPAAAAKAEPTPAKPQDAAKDAPKPADSIAKKDDAKPAAAAAAASAAQAKSSSASSAPKSDAPKPGSTAAKPSSSATSTSPASTKDSIPKRSAASDAGSRAQSSASSSSVPPRKPATTSDNSGGGIGGYALAGLLGGVIAVGAYYGLSSMNGDAGDVSGDLAARLEAIETQQSAAAEQRAQLEQKLADAEAAGGANPDEIAALREALDGYQNAAASRQEALSEQISDLGQANEELRTRLDAMAASGVEGGSVEAIAGIETAIAALKADVEALKAAPGSDAALGEVNQRLDALGARIGETETGLAQARDATAAIQQQMAQLSEQVAAAGGAQDAAQQAAVALALSDLRAAVNRGGSFTAELEALTALLPEAGEGDALTAAAAEGVATRRELAQGFDAIIRDVLSAADNNPNAGFFAKLFDNATSIVTVRPIGALAGDEPEAVVARIETQLDDGALTEALAEWQKLPPPAQQAGAQWAQSLERKVGVERKLDEIGRGVLSGLGQAS
ncbi:hypothetical protein ACKTEK_14460 [Tepidamorphus sp. 3E244]|uniref:COG4223 family protein n=1 Tax=Tepidamorphus sp. 3E244 TaxID=3385498 RepID=UPI0038FC3B3D